MLILPKHVIELESLPVLVWSFHHSGDLLTISYEFDYDTLIPTPEQNHKIDKSALNKQKAKW